MGKDESSRLTYLRLFSLRDSFSRNFIGRVIKDLTEGRPSLPVSNLSYAIARLRVLVNFKGLGSLHSFMLWVIALQVMAILSALGHSTARYSRYVRQGLIP